MVCHEQVIVIGDTVENIYNWIDATDLDLDDIRVVVTPDQLKGCKPMYVILVNGWLNNIHLGEILEMLLHLDRG